MASQQQAVLQDFFCRRRNTEKTSPSYKPLERLNELSECKNDSHFRNAPLDTVPLDTPQGARRSLSEVETTASWPTKNKF